MAQRGRSRPAGNPGGREPGRATRARGSRTRGTAGRAGAPRTTARARPGAGAASQKGTARTAAAPPGRIAGAWHAVSDRVTATGGGGMSPRRVVIVVVMVCFLALALANPVRTYFTQRSDAAAAAEKHGELVAQIAELQHRAQQLEDPDYIRAQARDRLGFVEAGKTPYIVELPGDAAQVHKEQKKEQARSRPWYGNVWDSVSHKAEEPVPAAVPNVIPAPAAGG